jgi:hypothetical protein
MIERHSDPWVDAENLAAEVERLGAALKEIQRATSLEMLATNHGKSGDIANEIATRALNGTAGG